MRTSLFKMLDKLNCCYKQTTPLCMYLWDMYYGPVALYYEIKNYVMLCYLLKTVILPRGSLYQLLVTCKLYDTQG